MRIITQFKPNMNFYDYLKSMMVGDVFMFKNNPLIYMVIRDSEHGRKYFVNDYGLMCDPSLYITRELLVIVRRTFESLYTVCRVLNDKFIYGR